MQRSQYKKGMDCYDELIDRIAGSRKLFEKLPELLRPQAVSKILGVSIATIYDWKYRGKTRKVPSDLFLKLNRSLYIRTDVLRNWIISNN